MNMTSRRSRLCPLPVFTGMLLLTTAFLASAATEAYPLGFSLQTSLGTAGQVAGSGEVRSQEGTTVSSSIGGVSATARGGWRGGAPTIGAYIVSPGIDLEGDNFASAVSNVLWSFDSRTLAVGTKVMARFVLDFDATMRTDSPRFVDTRFGLQLLDRNGQEVSNLFYENASLTMNDGVSLLGDYAGNDATSFELDDEGVAVANRGTSPNDIFWAEVEVGSTYIMNATLSTALGSGECGGTLSVANALNTLTYGFGGAVLAEDWSATDVRATSSIPEPSAYALLGGLAALGLVVWRRCHARAVAR